MRSVKSKFVARLGLAAIIVLSPCGSKVGVAGQQQSKEKPGQKPTDASASKPAAKPTSNEKAAKASATVGLKEFLSALLDGIRENDADAVSARIDSDRMLSEMERQGNVSALTPAEKTALRVALRLVVGKGLLEEGAEGGWKDFRVHRMASVDPASTSIVVHVINKQGRAAGVVQFWLTRDRKGDWKIFDWQEASSVFKRSTMVAVTVSAFREDAGSASLQRLVAAANAASRGDMESSEQILMELAEQQLPEAADAARWLLHAQIKVSQNEPAKALECLDQAAKSDPTMIALPKIKSLVYGQMDRPERALEFANEARKAYGEDAECYALIGNALARLGRGDDAIAAFRKGFDANPSVVDNLVGLAEVLPAGKKDEVAARLSRCPDANEAFASLAEALVTKGEKETLARINDAATKLGVEAATVDYYRAQAAALDGQTAAAVTSLNSAITKAGSEETKRSYGDQLLEIQLGAGRAVEAYENSNEPEYAFSYLARRLTEDQNIEPLLALSRAFAKRSPGSPDGFFYLGRALSFKEQYDDSARAFAKGIGLAKVDDQREAFRSNLVMALFKAGKGPEAYRDVAPRRATFSQLAELYVAAQQGKPLLDLITVARKDDPDSGPLDAWEADARALLKDYAGAAERYKAAFGRFAQGAARTNLINRMLDARIAAKQPAQGYADAPDKDYAFGYLCEVLTRAADPAGLNAVIEAHRAKSPIDARLLYYTGQAHMLAKDYRAAEKDFAKAIAQANNRVAAARFTNGRLRALCQLGEGLKAYDESKDKSQTYRLIGPLLLELNRPDDLVALVKAHRRVAPTEPTLGLWEAEAKWLAKDYEAVIELLTRDRDAILADAENLQRYEDRMVRSLLRLKNVDAAAKAAKQSTDRDGDPLFEAVVATSSGDVSRAAPLLRRCIELGYGLENFDNDPDAGPAFQSAPFRELRDMLAERVRLGGLPARPETVGANNASAK
jgi:hypothetical protein